MSSSVSLVGDAEAPRSQPAALVLLRDVIRTRGGKIGALLVCVVLALAFVGPYLAPFSPTALVGSQFATPTRAHVLGTDMLGRDGLSRFLWGGRTLVLTAFAATLMAYLVGIPLGAFAAVRGGILDIGAVALSDIMLAIPSLVFVLVLLAAVGPSLSMVAIGIAAVELPVSFGSFGRSRWKCPSSSLLKSRGHAARPPRPWCSERSCRTSGRR